MGKLVNIHEDRLHAQPAGGSPGHQAQQHHVCHRSARRPQDRALINIYNKLRLCDLNIERRRGQI